MSYAQQREWALERYRPSNNISGALVLEGDVDLDLLGRVLTEVMARHEVLRSTVEIVDGVPVQVVHPVSPIPSEVDDLSHLPEDEQWREVRRRYDEEVMRPFPPDLPQKMRATALRLGPDKWVALVTTHHAASDGWSMSLILREVTALFPAMREGREPDLPPPPIQYGDFAVWQRERLGDDFMAQELEYWREVLKDIPPRLALPNDRPYPVRRTFAGAHHTAELGGEDMRALQAFAEREGVSISMLMLAACSVVLYRYTDQDDLVFGSAITGRVRTETEQVIGCFANAIPFRIRLTRGETLLEVLHRAREVVSAAFDHQDIPFDRLVEELAPKEASQTPLIQMMINVVTAPGTLLRLADQVLEMPGLRISPLPVDPGPIPIDIIVITQAMPDAVNMLWHYSTELFNHDTIVRLAQQVQNVLMQLVHSPERRVADVDMLSLAGTGATDRAPLPAAADSSDWVGFLDLFKQQVEVAPDAAAVVCGGVELSYAELDARAEAVARRLAELGVGAESRVGVLVPRSPGLAVAVLGVLKAGAAFVPLDGDYPADRIGYMLSDAQAPVVLTTADLAGKAAGVPGCEPLVLDDIPDLDDGAARATAAVRPSTAAYVIYTSGSTGQPKGVVVEHRSLAVFARETVARLQLGAGDRFLQFASPAFDVLIEELFPIWSAGGAVVIPPANMQGPNLDLAALAERDRISVMELPAAYWHEWVRELDRTERALPGCLRLVIVGAERVLPERLAMWRRHRIPLMHVYGITETTVSSTFFRLPANPSDADLRHLPIGTPLPTVELHILDPDLKPVPVGAVGELYIGGPSVARGYHNRPDLTAERFIAHPTVPGARLYRSGDLVRQRPDGNLEFVSRADTQIKIRGYRVEPAEIESAMCRHPQIAQAIVTTHEPTPGDKRLVAYLVPQPRTRPSITDIRRFLAREIPQYLVPASFIQLDTIPLTSNGKIDYDHLPEPGDERPELTEELVLPQTPLERQLADIVAAVLGVTVVGANDNFFELGGDSILAIQVVARAQEQGINLSPLDLFEHPTVALLAEAASAAAKAANAEQAADAGQPGTAEAVAVPKQATGDAQADGTEQDTAGAVPTPSDFPLARVDQSQLDALLGRLSADQEG
ncbi:MAG TPA: amino acid adenylation domain-containing protein [Micromonosporaceae bacterium]